MFKVIKPLIVKKMFAVKANSNKIACSNTSMQQSKIDNEEAVSLYVTVEKNKENSPDPVAGEFIEKVILFGYLIVMIFKNIVKLNIINNRHV